MLRCDGCGTAQVSYNSCRSLHFPKCQASAAQRWLQERQADLLPVEYFHVVFTLRSAARSAGIMSPVKMYCKRDMESDAEAATCRRRLLQAVA